MLLYLLVLNANEIWKLTHRPSSIGQNKYNGVPIIRTSFTPLSCLSNVPLRILYDTHIPSTLVIFYHNEISL